MLPSADELKERYASWSNDRLLSVLHNKDQYTDQAVELARAELGQRNVTAADVDVFLEEQEEQQLAAKMLSSIPLKLWEKGLFFFVWFSPWFVGGAIRMNYREDGMILKLRQSQVFAIAGFISMLLDGVVTVYLDQGSASAVGILIVLFLVFIPIERKLVYDLSTE